MSIEKTRPPRMKCYNTVTIDNDTGIRDMRNMKNSHLIAAVRFIVLAAAIASLVYGAVSGQADAVLHKAAQICMECCGIG